MKGVSFLTKGEKQISASPDDFIESIRNAEYVLTDSFHAVVFSLIFHKEFYAFERFKPDSESSENSRLYDILKLAHLETRILPYDCKSILTQDYIDYQNIDVQLKPFIQSSKQFLDQAVRN
ncbi:MAG: polysaccharide pyruvyl transferase family protein [Lachnospiraceae bacterium]|nr:polysaccharide pyruvyl transferase family protein [Lachnospiraceae bacterium]